MTSVGWWCGISLPMHHCKTLPIAIFSLILGGISLVPWSQLHAGASNKSGNPFGNGTYFPNSGTFSAIERSSNGFLGIVQFSTSSTNSTNSSATNSGIATIYAEGNQFQGTSFGALNASGRTISATFSAVAASTVTVLPALTSTPVLDTNGNTVAIDYNSSLTNFASSNSCFGQFEATLQNSYPNQTFSGTGKATVQYTTVGATLVPERAFVRGGLASAYYNYTPTNVIVLYSPSVTGSRIGN